MPVDKFGRIIRGGSKKVVQLRDYTASDLSVTEMNDFFSFKETARIRFLMRNTMTKVSNPASDHDVANKVYVEENASGDDKVLKPGDTMEGDLNMAGNRITGLNSTLPLTSNDAVS